MSAVSYRFHEGYPILARLAFGIGPQRSLAPPIREFGLQCGCVVLGRSLVDDAYPSVDAVRPLQGMIVAPWPYSRISPSLESGSTHDLINRT